MPPRKGVNASTLAIAPLINGLGKQSVAGNLGALRALAKQISELKVVGFVDDNALLVPFDPLEGVRPGLRGACFDGLRLPVPFQDSLPRDGSVGS